MIENLPIYISVFFMLTTFLTIGLFFNAVKSKNFRSIQNKIFIVFLSLGLLVQAIFSFTGIYQNTSAMPPNILLFGVLPSLLVIIIYFVFFRNSFIQLLSLKGLTLIHIIRIPVEIVLFLLYKYSVIPQVMTFEGLNFDVLVGITAPIVYFIAFKRGGLNHNLLFIWNFLSLLLVLNIVAISVMSFPSPFQSLAFESPNKAVMYFPFIWLPTIIVPIVIFSHLASFWKLYKTPVQ